MIDQLKLKKWYRLTTGGGNAYYGYPINKPTSMHLTLYVDSISTVVCLHRTFWMKAIECPELQQITLSMKHSHNKNFRKYS